MKTNKPPTTYAVVKDNVIIGWTTATWLPDGYLLHTTSKKAIKGLPRLILTSDGVREVN